jgi:hypothetical protein
LAATAGADEELEGWDAALSNFDTAQDAAAPAAPTKEQQEATAARAMVSQHLLGGSSMHICIYL